MATPRQSALPAAAPTPEKKMLFFGRAWKMSAKNGKEFINGRVDRNFEVIVRDKKTGLEYAVADNESILMFNVNNKREGKKDADLSLAIRIE